VVLEPKAIQAQSARKSAPSPPKNMKGAGWWYASNALTSITKLRIANMWRESWAPDSPAQQRRGRTVSTGVAHIPARLTRPDEPKCDTRPDRDALGQDGVALAGRSGE
jgi:hypothetical protein